RSSFVFPRAPRSPRSTLVPYTTLFRSQRGDHRGLAAAAVHRTDAQGVRAGHLAGGGEDALGQDGHEVLLGVVRPQRGEEVLGGGDRKSTSELQSRFDLVCRLLLEKKKP